MPLRKNFGLAKSEWRLKPVNIDHRAFQEELQSNLVSRNKWRCSLALSEMMQGGL
ncbi:MAG TPA: hypothetical protein VFW05_19735 [Verrucomicrobiae bacterium]|nr:hypothetical protein [Verrucomicrobiae bacterium]